MYSNQIVGPNPTVSILLYQSSNSSCIIFENVVTFRIDELAILFQLQTFKAEKVRKCFCVFYLNRVSYISFNKKNRHMVGNIYIYICIWFWNAANTYFIEKIYCLLLILTVTIQFLLVQLTIGIGTIALVGILNLFVNFVFHVKCLFCHHTCFGLCFYYILCLKP